MLEGTEGDETAEQKDGGSIERAQPQRYWQHYTLSIKRPGEKKMIKTSKIITIQFYQTQLNREAHEKGILRAPGKKNRSLFQQWDSKISENSEGKQQHTTGQNKSIHEGSTFLLHIQSDQNG